MRYSYGPGPWLALAHQGAGALVHPDIPPAQVERVWGAMVAGAPMPAWVGEFTGSTGAYALVHLGVDGVRVLLRGSVSALVGGVRLSGRDGAPWAEHIALGVYEAHVWAEGATVERTYPLTGGVVFAQTLSVNDPQGTHGTVRVAGATIAQILGVQPELTAAPPAPPTPLVAPAAQVPELSDRPASAGRAHDAAQGQATGWTQSTQSVQSARSVHSADAAHSAHSAHSVQSVQSVQSVGAPEPDALDQIDDIDELERTILGRPFQPGGTQVPGHQGEPGGQSGPGAAAVPPAAPFVPMPPPPQPPAADVPPVPPQPVEPSQQPDASHRPEAPQQPETFPQPQGAAPSDPAREFEPSESAGLSGQAGAPGVREQPSTAEQQPPAPLEQPPAPDQPETEQSPAPAEQPPVPTEEPPGSAQEAAGSDATAADGTPQGHLPAGIIDSVPRTRPRPEPIGAEPVDGATIIPSLGPDGEPRTEEPGAPFAPPGGQHPAPAQDAGPPEATILSSVPPAQAAARLAAQAAAVPAGGIRARLRVSTGQSCHLTSPVLVGRSPQADAGAGDPAPQLLAVPSPNLDISRTHVDVRVEGDHVLVTDLRSTNGTVVQAPGASPRRLHAGESVAVSAGTIIDLGDGVTMTVEQDA